MDKGKLFTVTFQVIPGADGSFIASTRSYDKKDGAEWGFSTVADLLTWLWEHANAFNEARETKEDPSRMTASELMERRLQMCGETNPPVDHMAAVREISKS